MRLESRLGDRYIYDVSREFFEEHIPWPPKGVRIDATARHVYLRTSEDLLTFSDPQSVRFGNDAELDHYKRWAEQLVKINLQLMREDRVSDWSEPTMSVIATPKSHVTE